MVSEQLIKTLLDDIAEEKAYLQAIADKIGAGREDLLLQFPASSNDIYILAGATYTQEISINRSLKYLSIDAPEGVYITIYNDNVPVLFAVDEIGALEFSKGITINRLKITVSNTSALTQKWSIRMIFA